MHTGEINFDLRVILDRRAEFQARYIAVSNLKTAATTLPEAISDRCVAIVKELLDKELCGEDRQRLFLYREAAAFFVLLFLEGKSRSQHALSTLRHFLRTSDGEVHRAVAESLGSLSIPLPAPEIRVSAPDRLPEITFTELVADALIPADAGGKTMGRSIIFRHASPDEILVLKCAKDAADLDNLAREAAWMEHLRSSGYQFQARFHIPCPLLIEKSPLFRINGLPDNLIPDGVHHHETPAVLAFTAHTDYFRYPNEPDAGMFPALEELPEIMHQNGYLLGRLMHYGLVHTAPIPLFHNRLQQNRRDDHGLYDWPRAGRLDRWLESAAYPNIGLSGTRDFEHLQTLAHSDRPPYWHIGVHILSLLLVAGSCFRKRDSKRAGLDEKGNLVDARSLFDAGVLKKMVRAIFTGYYLGFAGARHEGELPFDLEFFVKRMIEEMGVDNHMEEFLRSHDQLRMTDAQFGEFLYTHGFSERKIKIMRRGAEDITLHTGPHLGGFNEGISLMELIRTTATISAMCILGRFQSLLK